MKTSKNQISKNTTVVKPANSLTNAYGQYKVKVNEYYFETDKCGHLYKSKSGISYTEWEDTGLTIENKRQFVNAVIEELND